VQQPAGQLAALHAAVPEHVPVAVEQVCPVPHAWHAAPPTPHLAFVSLAYGTQAPALQQPLGQVDALQVPVGAQTPLDVEQVCPVAHPAQAAPPVPQTVLL